MTASVTRLQRSAARIRQRAHRARERQGRITLAVEVDEVALAVALADAGSISADEQADQRKLANSATAAPLNVAKNVVWLKSIGNVPESNGLNIVLRLSSVMHAGVPGHRVRQSDATRR